MLSVVTSPRDHSLRPGESLTLRRRVPRTQETAYREAGRFPAKTHEAALDKLTMIAQQLAEETDRALKAPRSDRSGDMTLPVEAERAGRFLGFDDTGRPIAAAGGPTGPGPVSPFVASLLDDADAGAARATLGLDAIALDAGGEGAPAFRLFTVTDASAAYVGDSSGPHRRIDFRAGSVAFAEGQTVTGQSSGASGEALAVVVSSGSWAGGDAEGYLTLGSVTGSFQAGENLRVLSATRAVAAAGPVKVYDTRYLNGVWLACNLEWDAGEAFLSRRGDRRNETALALHIATDRHASGAFRAISLVRVQGASSAANPQSPARLASPTAGEAGGCETLQMWSDRGGSAFGGAGVALGGGAPGLRLCDTIHGGKRYTGLVVNAHADFAGADRANRASAFFGLRRGASDSLALVLLHEAAQDAEAGDAAAGAAPAWTECMAIPAAAGPLSAEIAVDPYATGYSGASVAHGLGGMPTGRARLPGGKDRQSRLCGGPARRHPGGRRDRPHPGRRHGAGGLRRQPRQDQDLGRTAAGAERVQHLHAHRHRPLEAGGGAGALPMTPPDEARRAPEAAPRWGAGAALDAAMLARIDERTRHTDEKLADLDRRFSDYVTRHEFGPVRLIAYGLAIAALAAVVNALIGSVVGVDAGL